MKFLKDVWMRIQLFVIKALGSRKFYAWAIATVLLIIGILTAEIWLAVTTIYTAAIVAEKFNKTEGK